MAETSDFSVFLVLLVAVTSVWASKISSDLQFNFDRQQIDSNEVAPDIETDYQTGDGYADSSSLASRWEAVKDEVNKVMKSRAAQSESDGDEAEVSPFSPQVTSRGHSLMKLYRRLIDDKKKRGLYGNVLKGYKLGKREFMPYELMNEYQKRLFGSVLNNYKYGKRVPEELPANYVTGGQIYDNISDDPRKRMFGAVLSGYKFGKRDSRLGSYRRGFRTPSIPFPTYPILQENLYRHS